MQKKIFVIVLCFSLLTSTLPTIAQPNARRSWIDYIFRIKNIVTTDLPDLLSDYYYQLRITIASGKGKLHWINRDVNRIQAQRQKLTQTIETAIHNWNKGEINGRQLVTNQQRITTELNEIKQEYIHLKNTTLKLLPKLPVDSQPDAQSTIQEIEQELEIIQTNQEKLDAQVNQMRKEISHLANLIASEINKITGQFPIPARAKTSLARIINKTGFKNIQVTLLGLEDQDLVAATAKIDAEQGKINIVASHTGKPNLHIYVYADWLVQMRHKHGSLREINFAAVASDIVKAVATGSIDIKPKTAALKIMPLIQEGRNILREIQK